MCEPGAKPQFDRLIRDLERAKAAWDSGETQHAKRILNLVASIAYAESKERGVNDPVPETSQG
jgi:hypothetical protein